MMKTVICGGGIVGVSIAYHLAKKGVKSTIVERVEPACAASGKAGGFLAKDWCDSYELGPLARISFEMHMSLMEDDDFKECEYRRLDTLSVSVVEGGTSTKVSGVPKWCDGSIVKSSVIGNTGTTAQVLPKKLTEVLLRKAKDLAGTEVKLGTVSGVTRTDAEDKVTDKITGVIVDGETILADIVIIALGPWSHEAMKWFNLAPIQGQRAHSIIVKPKSDISPHALFVEYKGKSRGSHSPEVYPRPDGTVYFCGMSDQEKLPTDPSDVQMNPNSCKTLVDMACDISASFKDAEVLTEQACYLPMSADGLPLIGAVPHWKGAFIATGHSCWGILNSLVTGEAMAQLIVDGKSTIVELEPFNPERFY